MKTKIIGTIMVILLFASMASLMPLTTAAQNTSKTISSRGTIVNNSTIYVTVDPTNTIASNNLSLGFVLDHHWNEWLKSPAHWQIAQNANFKLIRVYDFASDSGIRLQPCTYWNETTQTGVFNWTNVDALIESFYQIQAEPLICLGGTCGDFSTYFPNGMNINSTTKLPSPQTYANYCAAWVRHFKDVGLPVRFYEIFNEIQQLYYPYDNPSYYKISELSAFFNCYVACYSAMHAENNQILVGNDASLYRTFLDYWATNGGKLDFLSFHKYQCTGLTEPDSPGLVRAETRYFISDGTWYGISDARKVMGSDLPAIASENGWDATFSNGTDPRNQKIVSAVALALTLRQEALSNVQYNLYYVFCSSGSWESRQATSGGFGFGMVNDDGDQPWYPYYTNKLIGQSLSVGDRIVSSNSSSNDLRTLAWIHNGKLYTLVINTVDIPTTITLGSFANSAKFSLIDNTYAYTQPQVQTGIMNTSNELALKGYAVLLLESVTI